MPLIPDFSRKEEEEEINKASFYTKLKTELRIKPLEFYGCKFVFGINKVHVPTLKLSQKGQSLKLRTIDIPEVDL